MDNYIVSEVLHYCNISVPHCSQFQKHVIDFYDLTFVLNGSMTYIADGKSYTIKKNEALFLKPRTACQRLLGTEPVKYVSFNFKINEGITLNFPPHIKNCVSSDIKRIISAFPQSHLSPYFYSKQKATNMLNFILFEMLDIETLDTNNDHILKIYRYIEEHIAEPMNLSDISAFLGLSKEHTSYLFKKETGKTLTDYINERKMLLAKELISNGEMRLTDVASHLGYENYVYFSRLFKKYFDIAPIKLKNKF